MELFKNRPLSLMCFACIALALAVSAGMPQGCVITLFAALAVLFVAFLLFFIIQILHKKKDSPWAKRAVAVLLFSVMAVATLIGSADFFLHKRGEIARQNHQACQIEARVTEVQYSYSYGEKIHIQMLHINGKKVSGRAILESSFLTYLSEGDRFSAEVELTDFDESESYWIARGFCYQLICSDPNTIKHLSREKSTFLSFFTGINQKMQNIFFNHPAMERETGELLGALLLGNRDNLATKTIRDFRRCGISHLLALSGLHIMILVGCFDFFLRKMYVGKSVRCVLLSILALLYVFITGFSLAVIRAVIMVLFVYAAYWFRTDSDNVTALWVALFLIVAVSPSSIRDIGLWMSFLATLGILLVSSVHSELMAKWQIAKRPFYVRWGVKILLSLSVTLAAIVATCGIQWICFKEISLVSPLCNLIFAPVATWIMFLGIVFWMVSPLPWLSAVIAKGLNFLCLGMISLMENISQWRNIVLSMNYDFVPYIVIPLLSVLAFLILIRLKRKWLIFIPPLAAVIAFAVCLSVNTYSTQNVCEVCYLKNGKSEMLVMTNQGSAAVCDMSTGGYAHLMKAVEQARSMNATEIDTLLLTHYHTYHINSLQRLNERYRIRKIFLPMPAKESDISIYNRIVEELSDSGTMLYMYKSGESISLTDACCIEMQKAPFLKRSVQDIFALTVQGNRDRLTYLTSAYYESEGATLPEPTDFLILGTHGPNFRTSPSPAFFGDNHFSAVIYSEPLLLPETIAAVTACDFIPEDTQEYVSFFVFD